jgi:type VII secretion-associated serine protease mycosin
MTRTTRVSLAAVVNLLAVSTGVLVAPGAAHAETVRGLQWYLSPLRVAAAQAITQGQGVTVAVIDTGVDATHPDLAGQVLSGYGIGAGAAADGRHDSDTTGGHGTGMASLIVGKGGGDMHLLGIAPKAKILPIAVGGTRSSDDESQAIRWAVDHGAKVINISAGGQAAPSSTERAAVQYALSHDVVVVAAAGNRPQGDAFVGTPANIPGVVAVSAIGKDGQFWSGSVSGPETVVAAPGDEVITAAPAGTSPNGYFLGHGTSGATAIVSGVLALIRAKYPQANVANVINRLIRTARDLGPSGRDRQYGFGLVDPVPALTGSVPDVTANPLLPASGTTAPPAQSGQAGKHGPAVSVEANWPVVFGCLGVVLLVVVVVVVLIVRASRRRPSPAQPLPAYRPGPPPGYPPGYPPGPPPEYQQGPPGYRPGPPPPSR